VRFSGDEVFSPHPALVNSTSAAVRDLVAGLDERMHAQALEAAGACSWEAQVLRLPGYVDGTKLMPFGTEQAQQAARFEGGVDTHLQDMAELAASPAKL
jgi:hypothetical protein